jgi:hypothetical protein
MTTAEALAIAAKAKPTHRQPIDKLQTAISADQFATGVTALSKSYDAVGGTLADMLKQLERARAGVALYADAMNINLTETMQ